MLAVRFATRELTLSCLQARVTKERVAAVEAKIAAAERKGQPLSEMDAVAATDSTAKEEAIKDAQPQPIENGATKEDAVQNAEGAEKEEEEAGKTADAPETAAAEETKGEQAEEKEEGEIDE